MSIKGIRSGNNRVAKSDKKELSTFIDQLTSMVGEFSMLPVVISGKGGKTKTLKEEEPLSSRTNGAVSLRSGRSSPNKQKRSQAESEYKIDQSSEDSEVQNGKHSAYFLFNKIESLGESCVQSISTSPSSSKKAPTYVYRPFKKKDSEKEVHIFDFFSSIGKKHKKEAAKLIYGPVSNSNDTDISPIKANKDLSSLSASIELFNFLINDASRLLEELKGNNKKKDYDPFLSSYRGTDVSGSNIFGSKSLRPMSLADNFTIFDALNVARKLGIIAFSPVSPRQQVSTRQQIMDLCNLIRGDDLTKEILQGDEGSRQKLQKVKEGLEAVKNVLSSGYLARLKAINRAKASFSISFSIEAKDENNEAVSRDFSESGLHKLIDETENKDDKDDIINQIFSENNIEQIIDKNKDLLKKRGFSEEKIELIISQNKKIYEQLLNKYKEGLLSAHDCLISLIDEVSRHRNPLSEFKIIPYKSVKKGSKSLLAPTDSDTKEYFALSPSKEKLEEFKKRISRKEQDSGTEAIYLTSELADAEKTRQIEDFKEIAKSKQDEIDLLASQLNNIVDEFLPIFNKLQEVALDIKYITEYQSQILSEEDLKVLKEEKEQRYNQLCSLYRKKAVYIFPELSKYLVPSTGIDELNEAFFKAADDIRISLEAKKVNLAEFQELISDFKEIPDYDVDTLNLKIDDQKIPDKAPDQILQKFKEKLSALIKEKVISKEANIALVKILEACYNNNGFSGGSESERLNIKNIIGDEDFEAVNNLEESYKDLLKDDFPEVSYVLSKIISDKELQTNQQNKEQKLKADLEEIAKDIKRKNAATNIQRIFRGKQGRKAAQELREQNAATYIQRIFRGEQGRKAAGELKAEKLAAERLKTERLEAERLEAERLKTERLEAERLEAERLEAERLEAERLEAERLEAERLEAKRLEAERLEAERLEAERLEAERLEAERLEAKRLEAERLEAKRLEAERLEAERLEAERLEAERLEAERLEAKRLEAERLEAERLEAEEAKKKKAATDIQKVFRGGQARSLKDQLLLIKKLKEDLDRHNKSFSEPKDLSTLKYINSENLEVAKIKQFKSTIEAQKKLKDNYEEIAKKLSELKDRLNKENFSKEVKEKQVTELESSIQDLETKVTTQKGKLDELVKTKKKELQDDLKKIKQEKANCKTLEKELRENFNNLFDAKNRYIGEEEDLKKNKGIASNLINNCNTLTEILEKELIIKVKEHILFLNFDEDITETNAKIEESKKEIEESNKEINLLNKKSAKIKEKYKFQGSSILNNKIGKAQEAKRDQEERIEARLRQQQQQRKETTTLPSSTPTQPVGSRLQPQTATQSLS